MEKWHKHYTLRARKELYRDICEWRDKQGLNFREIGEKFNRSPWWANMVYLYGPDFKDKTIKNGKKKEAAPVQHQALKTLQRSIISPSLIEQPSADKASPEAYYATYRVVLTGEQLSKLLGLSTREQLVEFILSNKIGQ